MTTAANGLTSYLKAFASDSGVLGHLSAISILSFSRSLSHSSIFFRYFGHYNISNVFSVMSDDILGDSSHPCYYYFEGVDRTGLVHSHIVK